MTRNRSWWKLGLIAAVGLSGVADLTYVVAKGDTLTGIARRHGRTVREIAELNHIPNVDFVRIGQQLRIPDAAPAPQAAPVAAVAAVAAPGATPITVAPGENLSRIASRYGTTVAALVQLNGLANPDRVRVGQTLLVPAPPRPPTVEELLVRYSREYRVDPFLVKGLAWQESGWQQDVISRTGALGVMQVQPDTGLFTGRHLLASEVDLADLEHNIRTGVRFLAYLLRETNGNERYAVASYFQGLASVRKRGILPETRRYVANVLALKARFAGAG